MNLSPAVAVWTVCPVFSPFVSIYPSASLFVSLSLRISVQPSLYGKTSRRRDETRRLETNFTDRGLVPFLHLPAKPSNCGSKQF